MGDTDLKILRELKPLNKIHLDAIDQNLDEILETNKSVQTLLENCRTDIFSVCEIHTNEQILNKLNKTYINLLKCIKIIQSRDN